VSELTPIVILLAIIGLLLVWHPPLARTDAEGRKVHDPLPGEDVCPLCKGALLTTHKHGVWVHPRPAGPRPGPVRPGPSSSIEDSATDGKT